MTTLSRRFSGAFLLLVVLPSLVVSVILSRLYLGTLYETVEQHSQATAEQAAQQVQSETEGIAVLAAALFHDGELRRLAGGYAEATGATERFIRTRALDEKLVSFFTYSNRTGEVVLYLRHGVERYVYRFSNDPGLPPDTLDRSELDGARADPGKVFLLDTLEVAPGAGKHTISIAVCPAPDDAIPIDAILVRLRVPAFDALSAGSQGNGPDIVVLGRSGRPILTSLSAGDMADLAILAGADAPDAAHRSFRPVRAGSRSWLATVQPLASTGWTLVLLTDEAALSRRVTRHAWYLYPAIALLAVLFMVYAELFFARIATPMRAIIERTERERLTAELEALRYQINPHFIANTLNSIQLMAAVARADAIVTMTRDLMRMVSDSYAGAGVLTELSRELASIAAYVSIMKVRFGDRFALEVDVQPGTESLLVLRMLLQPIVENAILHGFGTSATGGAVRGTIRVTARREVRAVPRPPCPEPSAAPVAGEVLVLEVRDDGVGMTPREPARSGGPESLHRIGIANVERRIALNFGAPYQLAIDSAPGQTRVRYVLPALVRIEPEEHGDA